MSFEIKTQKAIPKKLKSEKLNSFPSPDKKISSIPEVNPKSSRDASGSPRYRSPIHTRLNLESADQPNCPTCEKRAAETGSVIFHESPPKVRPSHHNIVCEDCSEGSFSKVLKVVCLNEGQELPNGTQKIKIIESVPPLSSSSSFPVIGTGKSMQVLYQEVYPPPKPELTSLINENLRENGTLNYQMKEEERKRVAIRRAEYANRIKGVSKTIVTTISGNSDRLDRRERLSVSVEKPEVFEKSEKLCRSEKKRVKADENEENLGKQGKSEEGVRALKSQNNKKISRDSSIEQKSSKEKKEPEIAKLSYFQRIHEQSLKDSIENSKVSVKHKILAKLAGKDFAHLLQNKEEEEEKGASESEEEEALLSADNSVFNENSVHSNNEENEVELQVTNSEEHNELGDRQYLHTGINMQHSDRNLMKDDKDLNDADRSKDPAEEEKVLHSSNDDFNKTIKSLNSDRNPDKLEEEKVLQDSPVSLSKTVKSGQNTDRSKGHPEDYNQPLNAANENLKTGKFAEGFLDEENSELKGLESKAGPDLKAEEFILRSEKNSFGDLVKTETIEEVPAFQEFTLELHSAFESSPSSKRDTPEKMNRVSLNEFRESDLAKAQKVDSEEGTEKFPNSDESRQNLYTGAQELAETPSRGIPQEENFEKQPKTYEKNAESEETITPERFNRLFLVLTDPQVIKGLKLLGGFADYLEKNGKEVLNWKP